MSTIFLEIIISLISCIRFESDIFVDSYYINASKYYCRFHKMSESFSYGSIKKSDSLLFIPCLTFSKRIEKEWDFNIPENNKKYASWHSFDYKNKKPSEIILFDNNKYRKLYVNIGTTRHTQFIESKNLVAQSLLEKASLFKPNGIFTIYNISGWFFIMGEKIVFFELHNQQLIHHDDALSFLRQALSQADFLPVFSGQEI